jgi:hypothetical protein
MISPERKDDMYRSILKLSVFALAIVVAGCDGSPTASRIRTTLLSLSPTGGSAQVDPDRHIEVTFSSSMMAGMERYVELHEGDYTGPVVSGTWSWAPATMVSVISRSGPIQARERTTLFFTPNQALRPGTGYTVHLGGNLRDANGNSIDYASHGERHIQGEWVGAGRMAEAGMMMGQGHMVSDWVHANGSYGMAFTFTTAE